MTTPEDTEEEINRLQESADFWRVRANMFEEALRKIVSASDPDRDALAERRWEIANDILSFRAPETRRS